MPFVVCWLRPYSLFDVGCAVLVVACWLFVVCSRLVVVWCLLCVVLVFAVC